MHWKQNRYVWAEFSAQAASWKSNNPSFTDIECRQMASATHVDHVILKEDTPLLISSLDFAYYSGNPAKIVASHKVTASKQAIFISENLTFQMKVTLFEKKGSFYFLTFTGALSIDFNQNTRIDN